MTQTHTHKVVLVVKYISAIFAVSFMKQFVKDYLTFTKKERVAVVILVVLILVIFLLPYWFPVTTMKLPADKEIAAWKRQLDQLKKTDSTATKNNNTIPDMYAGAGKKDKAPVIELFSFDPNNLSPDGWRRLGVRDRTIQTIQHYLAKGGKFKRPEDLQRIYGLSAGEVKQLLPYVKIITNDKQLVNEHIPKEHHSTYAPNGTPINIPDINTADTTAFIALPGIGSKLAARIINFRDKLGGFYTVDQVGETYGLPDSTFRKIKTLLQCTNSTLRQFNINEAGAADLKQHPYIGWRLANVMVEYRNQHGSFKTVDDLLKIDIITPELFKKLRPYLVEK
jgi:competence protein ComEA